MESDLDLGRKMTKLNFFWGGGVESDLDLGRKMTKLNFLGWGWGGVGGEKDFGCVLVNFLL